MAILKSKRDAEAKHIDTLKSLQSQFEITYDERYATIIRDKNTRIAELEKAVEKTESSDKNKENEATKENGILKQKLADLERENEELKVKMERD